MLRVSVSTTVRVKDIFRALFFCVVFFMFYFLCCIFMYFIYSLDSEQTFTM